MNVLAHFRAPFVPHHEVAVQEVSRLKYAFQLNRPGRATFSVSRDTQHPAQYLALGMFVTLERDDEVLPWGGFVTQRTFNLASPTVEIQADDHYGALFSVARTAKEWDEVEQTSGATIRSVFSEANSRAEPPLGVILPDTTGPVVAYTAKAETISTFLRTMTRVTDWEWGLRYVVGGGASGPCFIRLLWQQRLGIDRSAQTWFEDGVHFRDAKLTEKAIGFIATGLSVGGQGTFKDRPAESVSSLGMKATSAGGINVTAARVGLARARFGDSPALSGTRVVIEQQITNRPALLAASRRLHAAQDQVGESLEFSLRESDIDMTKIGLGDFYAVRFKDLALGDAVERRVRIRSLTLGHDGIVGVVTDLSELEDQSINE